MINVDMLHNSSYGLPNSFRLNHHSFRLIIECELKCVSRIASRDGEA